MAYPVADSFDAPARAAIVADDIECAAELYLAWRRADPTAARPAANHAEMLLKLGDWYGALEAADAALAIDASHAKATFRRARALARLGHYSEAATVAATLHEPEVCDFVVKCREWHVQASSGDYNWSSILRSALEHPSRRFDVAEFIGAIKVVPIAGRGLGVRACRDILQGELIVVSKAVGIYEYRSPSDSVPSVVNRVRGGLDKPASVALSTKIARDLRRAHCTRGQILSLSRGRYAGMPVTGEDGDAVVLKDIISSNAFNWLPWTELFGTDVKSPVISLGGGTCSMPSSAGIGLWIYPSRFNHACEPNCQYAFVGDLMVIRAATNITAENELTVSYVPRSDTVGPRLHSRFGAWGFDCHCDICRMDAEPPPLPSPDGDWRLLAMDEEAAIPRVTPCSQWLLDAQTRVASHASSDALLDPPATELARVIALPAKIAEDLRALPSVAKHLSIRPLTCCGTYLALACRFVEAARCFEDAAKAAEASISCPFSTAIRAYLFAAHYWGLAMHPVSYPGAALAREHCINNARRIFQSWWPSAVDVFRLAYTV